ncbi:MAG: VUT family protein, partial [Bacteroidota bacterium]|nr:VUT family protein [Bacteroidota bacterium]MDX5431836.1 VUT family protein [Bacteroidota bacterium]
MGAFFLCNALIAEFIGVKIFSAEKSLGFEPLELTILGSTLSFNMTAGVLLWPVVFVMTDLINEYFGRKGVRFFSYLTAVLIAYAFLMVALAMNT